MVRKDTSKFVVNSAAKAAEEEELDAVTIPWNDSENEESEGDREQDSTRNSAAPKKFVTDPSLVINQMQTLTANLDTTHVRYRKLDGTNYMVCPMVMLTEGVHAGSNGPLMYHAAEMAKTPVLWDHKPVTINHPTINGQPVSACSPAAIEAQKVGMILNTEFQAANRGQPARLKSEAWLLPEKLKQVSPEVFNAVKRGQVVEVSTGLFCDQPKSTGVWNKEYYDAEAMNFRADHLAILPNEKGSCSIEDGAGLMRNARTPNPQRGVTNMKSKRSLVDAIISNEHLEFDEDNRDFLDTCDEEFLEKILAPVANREADDEEGNNDQSVDAKDQISPKKGGKVQRGSPQDAGKSADGQRKVKPKDKAGRQDDETDIGKTDKEKQDDEDDIGPDGAQPDGSAVRNQELEIDMMNDELTANYSEASPEEYLTSLDAPPAIKEMLRNGARLAEQHRSRLIERITSNGRCRFSDEYLSSRSMDELEGLAALATPEPVANVEHGLLGGEQRTIPVLNGMFAGQGDGYSNPRGGFTTNREEALDIPRMKFAVVNSKKSKVAVQPQGEEDLGAEEGD